MDEGETEIVQLCPVPAGRDKKERWKTYRCIVNLVSRERVPPVGSCRGKAR